MDFTNGEFADNIGRASNLIAASRRLADISGAPLAEDVLRAATVFLHASLEEVIRNLLVLRLPNVAPEKLDEIPLAVETGLRRSSKILLGSLVQFRGKFVDNVITDSIHAYVDTFNLNNTSQLAQCLELAEIETATLRQHFLYSMNECSAAIKSFIKWIGKTDLILWTNRLVPWYCILLKAGKML